MSNKIREIEQPVDDIPATTPVPVSALVKAGDYWVHWKHGSSRWCAVWINDERVYFAGDPKAYAIDRFDIGPEITLPEELRK